MVVLQAHQCFLPAVYFLIVGQVIRGNAFLLHQISHILFISQNFDNLAVGPLHIALTCFETCLPQLPGDYRGALLFNAIFMEDKPHQLRALGIDRELSVLDIVAQK